ncbi:winged helix-turn-helix domain-containing protein [Micromonospora sp. ATCC 39149]|uniref:GntR family transcriptional regulator n=1 Tax=Micromonospora sp. (strain ATCC 39149 / NRRL 15099 / SCC 1413) TaxID=219305 RepID=UPI0006802F05|nr:winged helix-turn-helix domain-containing protein [Micromonospora sp. ATCC 39149]
MISPHSGVPAALQLAALLRARIQDGTYAAGGLLPSETRLSQEYGVGRGTVRRAVAELRAEGLVDAASGRGTRVRGPVELDELVGEPDQFVMARMPTPEERAEMNIPEGVPVLVVRNPDGLMDVYPADEVGVRIPRA